MTQLDVHDATERYLANPVFRAARYEELVVDDNPYRRPVRPDDIGLVDFGTPLDRERFCQLSALMGHRMLLNIYDTRKLILPTAPTEEKWRDFELFYDDANRVLGDLIRPYLEAHLFDFVRAEAEERVHDDPARLYERLGELADVRRAAAVVLDGLVSGSANQASMTEMMAIQTVATSLNARLQPAVALPVRGRLRELLSVPGKGEDIGREVAESAGVKYEPHSYFQYYLPSTLALMNYVNAAAQDPSRVFRLVGSVLAQQGPDVLAAAREVVSEVSEVGGPFAVRELSRGLEEYAILLELHDEDYRRQFTWIDAMPEYRDKAERLQKAIEEFRIPVDLDTFVESWEECSTTHVHDEDRLLIIESGEMEFWNCYGARHKYRPGDKAFIPKHRLHGSVVLTGECVYHQPVITPELDAQHG